MTSYVVLMNISWAIALLDVLWWQISLMPEQLIALSPSCAQSKATVHAISSHCVGLLSAQTCHWLTALPVASLKLRQFGPVLPHM